jgi:hypothetical protein
MDNPTAVYAADYFTKVISTMEVVNNWPLTKDCRLHRMPTLEQHNSSD